MFKATVTVKPSEDGKGCGDCPYLRVGYEPFCVLFVTRDGEERICGNRWGFTRRCKPCRDAEAAAKAEGGEG